MIIAVQYPPDFALLQKGSDWRKTDGIRRSENFGNETVDADSDPAVMLYVHPRMPDMMIIIIGHSISRNIRVVRLLDAIRLHLGTQLLMNTTMMAFVLVVALLG